jgi:transcriptional regulator
MARSSGSTLQASLAVKERILALAASGLKQGEIASQVGKDRTYICRVLKQHADGRLEKHQRKVSALDTAVGMKVEDGYAGPDTLAYELFTLGYGESEIPSNKTLYRAIRACL